MAEKNFFRQLLSPFEILDEYDKAAADRRLLGKINYETARPSERAILERLAAARWMLVNAIGAYGMAILSSMYGGLALYGNIVGGAATVEDENMPPLTKLSAEQEKLFNDAGLLPVEIKNRQRAVEHRGLMKDFLYEEEPKWRAYIKKVIEEGDGKTVPHVIRKTLLPFYELFAIPKGKKIITTDGSDGVYMITEEGVHTGRDYTEDFFSADIGGLSTDPRRAWFKKHNMAFYDEQADTLYMPSAPGEEKDANHKANDSYKVTSFFIACRDAYAFKKSGRIDSDDPAVREHDRFPAQILEQNSVIMRIYRSDFLANVAVDPTAVLKALKRELESKYPRRAPQQEPSAEEKDVKGAYATIRLLMGAENNPTLQRIRPALVQIAQHPELIDTIFTDTHGN